MCDRETAFNASQTGNLTSPLYPYTYPSRLDCSHVLTAPEGHRIRFNVAEMDLDAANAACSGDHVAIASVLSGLLIFVDFSLLVCNSGLIGSLLA